MSNPNSETKVNAHDLGDSVPPLDMRQMDKFLLNQVQKETDSNRRNSNRLTEVETNLHQLKNDLQKLERHQETLARCQEEIAMSMSSMTHNLAAHMTAEENQWVFVNANHKQIEDLSKSVQNHFYEAYSMVTRVDWLERLMWAAWGVIGAAAATLIPLALRGMGVL
jgi:DNA anti-recombination protein RmuC